MWKTMQNYRHKIGGGICMCARNVEAMKLRNSTKSERILVRYNNNIYIIIFSSAISEIKTIVDTRQKFRRFSFFSSGCFSPQILNDSLYTRHMINLAYDVIHRHAWANQNDVVRHLLFSEKKKGPKGALTQQKFKKKTTYSI